ncbi:MAG: hypothetical protein M9921_10575 [Fimbriimonadaceae bacterium]|nr:hypothetical protein [Chthonomonadaceae bacterium]MCO5297290.1 hypothetical protein [Fimbriimonadaceae bacterium]
MKFVVGFLFLFVWLGGCGGNSGCPNNDDPVTNLEIAYRLIIDDWVVKPGDAFEVQLELKEPTPEFLQVAHSIRVTHDSPSIGTSPWLANYPGGTNWPQYEMFNTSVELGAPDHVIHFQVQILDANGNDLNDLDPKYHYSGSDGLLNVRTPDASDYDIHLQGNAQHFLDWNPYKLHLAVANIPDDTHHLRVLPGGSGLNSVQVPVGDVLDGQTTVDFNLPQGSTTFSVRWEYLDGRVIRFGNHDQMVVDTQAGGGPQATISWDPWILKPGEQATVTIRFAAPCNQDSTYQFVSGTATFQPSEIQIPAGQTEASLTMIENGSRFGRFTVFSTAACHSFNGNYDYFCLPAGTDAFQRFYGPVVSNRGAHGNLEINGQYSILGDAGAMHNDASWVFTYIQDGPIYLVAHVTTPGFPHVGTFQGPDGQYQYDLRPYSTAPYANQLLGTLRLIRPDATDETFTFSLPKE